MRILELFLGEAVDVASLDVDKIEPEQKDHDRAEGLHFQGSDFDNSGHFGEASKMAKLIKDPKKLVRRSKAIVAWYGTSKQAWNPFVQALRDMGFSDDQIEKIQAYKYDHGDLIKAKKWIADHWIGTTVMMAKVWKELSLSGNTIKLSGSLPLSLKNVKDELPYQFESDSEYIQLYFSRSHLKSMKNFPRKCGGLSLDKSKIDSIAGGPEEFYGQIYLSLKSSIDFTGIKKICKKMTGAVYVGDSEAKGLLGLLYVPGFKKIITDKVSNELEASAKIINKYVGQGNSGIIKAQRELLDSDLDDQAEL